MSKIYYKVSHGVYVLTTNSGGCVVDAVSQISSEENPLFSIAIMKSNNTNELVHTNDNIVLSILSQDVDSKVIEVFGHHSMKEMNKFEEVETIEIGDILVPSDIIGYMELKIEDRIENDTHTVLICRYQDGKILDEDKEEMTYNYYRKHKDEYVKVTTENNKTAWICTMCGYVYYGEEIPEDFSCPVCGVDKDAFIKKDS